MSDDGVEDDQDVEAECEVCGELTALHCNRCLFVVCADCECPNGCDAPPDPNLEPMTKLSDIGKKSA